jgi:2-keto-4-pentenoate hydratase/2-oxohepta-3-ene-1,7-dioic acid hydratase in catechol pathway
MRLATVIEEGKVRVAVVQGEQVAILPALGGNMRQITSRGPREISGWLHGQPESVFRALDEFQFGPAVPDPGAIYTIGLNYRDPANPNDAGPERPLVYGKAATSVVGHKSVVSWDRALTDNVDGECELGVVIGQDNSVFGYTIVNDISSRDPWLDGDQWLLGKSMPGFCPVGPWIVTADELDPADLRLGCKINGEAIQDGRTSDMRFSIAQIIEFLGRHVRLRPGDLIATGTPARLTTPPGPDRRLQPGDVVSAWIEGIGELTNTIA